jgi:hypothetical protein
MIYIGIKIVRDKKFLSGILKEHPEEENTKTMMETSIEN